MMLKISQQLGKKWKMFARWLSLDDSQIENIESDNPSNSQEMAFQVLKVWKDSNGESATEEVVFEALIKCGLKSVVDDLKPDYNTV